ncbi:MAG: hypothetical protein ABIA92_00210 [Patescibacteria group bacterium]
MNKLLIPCIFGAILIAGCAPASPPAEEEPIEEPPDLALQEEEPPIRETRNVIYQGIVKPAGISIYMQGSHRLQLPDGKFILLESNTVDLNGYVNENVELLGALRPTVEAGGMIMRVEQARLIVDEEPLQETTETTDAFEAVPPADDIIQQDEETAEPEEPQDEAPPDDVTDIATGNERQPPEEEPIPSSPEISARTQMMASDSFSANQWTQQYCTSHIGFCIPVHRNWWFKSFGATSTSLWHVELSSEEIRALYDGPIQVNLVTGTVGSKKTTDGQVREQDGQVVGYREWNDNRHFEIKGQLTLEEAVRYITTNLREYVE